MAERRVSTTSLIVLRCDRCGHATDPAERVEREGWAKIQAGVIRADAREVGIGTSAVGPADICPGCTTALFAWWSTVDGKAPPAPPPPAPRGPTAEQRRAATERAIELLREQAGEAVAAVRARPTAAISDEELPAASAGAHARAEQLVRLVLRDLTTRRRS